MHISIDFIKTVKVKRARSQRTCIRTVIHILLFSTFLSVIIFLSVVGPLEKEGVRLTKMEDDFNKRAPRFDAGRGENYHLWALRFEALGEYKDVSSVLFEDAMGGASLSELPEDVRKKVVKARALILRCLGPRAVRTVAPDKKNPH